MNENRPNISFDTNILKKFSMKDWILWVYEDYRHKGEKKEEIRKILTLGRSKIRLVISEMAYREFVMKNPRDIVDELLNHLFTIHYQDEELIVSIHELSTSLGKLYSQQRDVGDPDADHKDIVIFLESWHLNCDFLLSDDKFLKSFENFICKEISKINSFQTNKEKEGKIERLTSYILKESRRPTIINFLSNLLSVTPPQICQTEEFLKNWEIEEDDQNKLAKELLFFQEERSPETISEEVRKAIVHIENKHEAQDKIMLIDELLKNIAPEIFESDLMPPPYEEEIQNILNQTLKFLKNMRISSIVVDFGIPGYTMEIFHSGETRATYDGETFYDFDFDDICVYILDENGYKIVDTVTEIDLDTLEILIKSIEIVLREESERKANDWKSFWKNRSN